MTLTVARRKTLQNPLGVLTLAIIPRFIREPARAALKLSSCRGVLISYGILDDIIEVLLLSH